MRIDSSSIGMGSTRRYSSVSGRVSRFMLTNGRQSLQNGAGLLSGNLFGTNVGQEYTKAKGQNQTNRSLQDRLKEMQSQMRGLSSGNVRNTQTDDARKQLQDIRQQCIVFLMDLLFPGRSRNTVWDQGLSKETGQENQNVQNDQSAGSSNVSSGSGTSGRMLQMTRMYYRHETENTSFQTTGTVRCADGREISFNLNLEMSRSFEEYYQETVNVKQMSYHDPLVINLDGNIAELSDQTFLFDLDGDGELDEINRLSAGSGFLALDKNGDGVINDGNELFGTKSGNGFADLAAYDEDGNGFIDEGDEIWDKLKIWVMEDNGEQKLYSLAEMGVGAICLQNASTDFSLMGENNQANGMIRRTGVFLYESGMAGTVQHVDLGIHSDGENKHINMQG